MEDEVLGWWEKLTAICLQRQDATDFFFSFLFSPCFLGTPARSNMKAAPDAGAIAQVHAGVPPARGRQHKTQIKSTAAPQHLLRRPHIQQQRHT